MLVQDGITLKTHIPQKVAGFFITQSFYAFFLNQPVSPLMVTAKAVKLFAKTKITVLTEKIPRVDYVSRSGVWVPVHPLQSGRKLFLSTVHQQRPDRVHSVQSHPGRAPTREEAKDHFLPDPFVSASLSNSLKFAEPGSNLLSPLAMDGLNSLKCQSFDIFLHKPAGLLILGVRHP